MTRLIWSTPSGEDLLVYMARVSNPEGQERGDSPERLIRYLIRHRHWSPFEMVSACVEIEAPRDVSRQLLRHRSFAFQEFSQRYQTVEALPEAPLREARMQDPKNRQNSLPCEDEEVKRWWLYRQHGLLCQAMMEYRNALRSNVAKEVARAVLPEGLTKSRLYMAGTLRSWLHFCSVRSGEDTQAETRQIAHEVADLLREVFPATWLAFEEHDAMEARVRQALDPTPDPTTLNIGGGER